MGTGTRLPALLTALGGALALHVGVALGLLHAGAARTSSVQLLDAFSVVVLPEALAREEPPEAPPEAVPEPLPEPEPEPEPTPEPLLTQKPPPVPEPPAVRPRPKPKAAPRPKAPRHPREAATGTAAVAAAPAAVPTAVAAPEPFSPPRSDADYLHNPRPPYPRLARQQRMQGRVLLEVRVSAEGLPLGVILRSSSGFDLLDQAASEAVRRWRFVPARRGGRAVEALVEIPIRFVLSEEK